MPASIDRRDIERSLDEVDRDMEDLDCATARQLANRISARVVLCASYEEVAEDVFALTAQFYDVGSGESFAVQPATSAEREEEAAARHIFDQFGRYTRQLRAEGNCEEYARSRLWEDALRNCDEALALNPDAIGARYRRARVLFDSGSAEGSLSELERVLERDPIHETALQLAGYIAATLERSDDALGYYTRFLQLSPEDAFVRMRVAYELATAGELRGALTLIREGLDLDVSNVDLWEQLGGYSFTIGESINRRATVEDGGALAPDAVPYFRDAVEAYTRVFAARGAETNPGHLRSIVTAHVRLGDITEATRVGLGAVEAYPQDAPMWSAYADALRRAGRLQAALQALDRVGAIDPGYTNLGLRRGSWLIEAERIAEAVEVLRSVAQDDPEAADAASRLIFVDAYTNGIQRDDYEYAIESIVLAKTLPGLSEATLHELDFWHGYSILQVAAAEQEPRTLETARATLPRFQEALEVLSRVGDYPASVSVSIDGLLTSVETYIEIQQAIIRRGG